MARLTNQTSTNQTLLHAARLYRTCFAATSLDASNVIYAILGLFTQSIIFQFVQTDGRKNSKAFHIHIFDNKCADGLS